AGIVVGLVLAKPFEKRSRPRSPGAPLTRVVGGPPPQADLVPADLVKVGVDVRRRFRGDAALSLQQVERPAQADMDVPEAEAAAMPRARRVRRLSGRAGADDELGRAAIDIERGRDGVTDGRAERQRERIPQTDRDAVPDAD